MWPSPPCFLKTRAYFLIRARLTVGCHRVIGLYRWDKYKIVSVEIKDNVHEDGPKVFARVHQRSGHDNLAHIIQNAISGDACTRFLYITESSSKKGRIRRTSALVNLVLQESALLICTSLKFGFYLVILSHCFFFPPCIQPPIKKGVFHRRSVDSGFPLVFKTNFAIRKQDNND